MIRNSQLALLLSAFTLTAAAQSSDVSDAELAERFSVNGVLVGPDNRIAMINNQLTRVGEHVGEAQILAIELNTVHLRFEDRAFSMRVGSSLIGESRFGARIVQSGEPEFEALPQAASAEPVAATVSLESYWPVAPGETLSQIAAQLVSEAAQSAALMDELFALNPHAFGDNMDLLYAGAVLCISDCGAIPGGAAPPPLDAPHLASAAEAPPARDADLITVETGDTLSGIAVRLAIDGATLNQTMLALYEANPQAFGGNLNLLYAGETLRVPGSGAWRRRSPAAALAEVGRHTATWQSAASRYNST